MVYAIYSFNVDGRNYVYLHFILVVIWRNSFPYNISEVIVITSVIIPKMKRKMVTYLLLIFVAAMFTICK